MIIIYSIVHNVWRVTLRRHEPTDGAVGAHPSGGGAQGGVSINEQLIAENFADKNDESFLSKKSHREREEAPVSARTSSSADSFSFDEIASPSQDPRAAPRRTKELGLGSALRLPTKDDLNRNRGMARLRGNQIRLQGPSSAYEMRFYGLTTVGSYREAKMERDSVNSVCVDEEPGDPHDRMMVAAFVGLNASNESIIVRDTTLLPNTPGLLGILALAFCPFAELRCDRQKRRYTGVLCGLGADPATGDSAFPDHDMEIDFDFNFDEEDLGMVNAVRMGIHVAIGNELNNMDWDSHGILKVQQVTRDKLRKLVSKRRVHVEKYPSYHPYHWNLVDEDDIKRPITKESLHDADTPISLHAGIVLEEEKKVEEEAVQKLYELKHHLDDLHRRARTAFGGEVVCAACECKARNSRELQLHLRTMAHKSIEAEIQRELDAHAHR